MLITNRQLKNYIKIISENAYGRRFLLKLLENNSPATVALVLKAMASPGTGWYGGNPILASHPIRQRALFVVYHATVRSNSPSLVVSHCCNFKEYQNTFANHPHYINIRSFANRLR